MRDALPQSPRPQSQDFGGSADDCAGGLVVTGGLWAGPPRSNDRSGGREQPGMVIAPQHRMDRVLDAGDRRAVLDLGEVTVLGGQAVSVHCGALHHLARRGATIASAATPHAFSCAAGSTDSSITPAPKPRRRPLWVIRAARPRSRPIPPRPQGRPVASLPLSDRHGPAPPVAPPPPGSGSLVRHKSRLESHPAARCRVPIRGRRNAARPGLAAAMRLTPTAVPIAGSSTCLNSPSAHGDPTHRLAFAA